MATIPFGVESRVGKHRHLTQQERCELATIEKLGFCALCRREVDRLVTEHDHEIGKYAVRGLTCQACNSGQIAGVDAGRFAIDRATRHYLMNPWYLTRLGHRLAYDPVVRVSIAQLGSADRQELDRVTESNLDSSFSMRKAPPVFEHPRIADLVQRHEFRAVLRLRLFNLRGNQNLDIAELGDRMSAFQELHLNRVRFEHGHEWAVDAASVFHLTRRADAEGPLTPTDEFADVAKDAA